MSADINNNSDIDGQLKSKFKMRQPARFLIPLFFNNFVFPLLSGMDIKRSFTILCFTQHHPWWQTEIKKRMGKVWSTQDRRELLKHCFVRKAVRKSRFVRYSHRMEDTTGSDMREIGYKVLKKLIWPVKCCYKYVNEILCPAQWGMFWTVWGTDIF
jgi:hypothetical protein